MRLAVELLQNKLSSEAVSNVYEIDSNDSVENDEAILKELAKILSEMPLCEKIVVESVFI